MQKTDKKVKKYFEPTNWVIEKNARNIESLQLLSGLKPKSKEFQFVCSVVFDKDTSKIKLNDSEFKNLGIVLSKMEKENPFVKPQKNKRPKKNEKNLRYLELMYGLKPKSKEFQFLCTNIFDKKTNEKTSKMMKAGKSKKWDLAGELLVENIANIENLKRIAKGYPKKGSPAHAKREKFRKDLKIKAKNLASKASELTPKTIKKLEDTENKLETLSHLKDSCPTCNKTISNTYRKNQIKKYKKRKKEIVNKIELLKKLENATIRLTNQISNEPNYRSFKEAKIFVQKLRLKSKKQWDQHIKSGKLPADIPLSPHIAYSADIIKRKPNENNTQYWSSYSDWLGTPEIKFRKFAETKKFIKKFKIDNLQEWRKLVNSGILPADIPRNPERVYKKSWVGWKKFLDN